MVFLLPAVYLKGCYVVFVHLQPLSPLFCKAHVVVGCCLGGFTTDNRSSYSWGNNYSHDYNKQYHYKCFRCLLVWILPQTSKREKACPDSEQWQAHVILGTQFFFLNLILSQFCFQTRMHIHQPCSELTILTSKQLNRLCFLEL